MVGSDGKVIESRSLDGSLFSYLPALAGSRETRVIVVGGIFGRTKSTKEVGNNLYSNYISEVCLWHCRGC